VIFFLCLHSLISSSPPKLRAFLNTLDISRWHLELSIVYHGYGFIPASGRKCAGSSSCR
jgi:hypothetical protein